MRLGSFTGDCIYEDCMGETEMPTLYDEDKGEQQFL